MYLAHGLRIIVLASLHTTCCVNIFQITSKMPDARGSLVFANDVLLLQEKAGELMAQLL